jgi:[protein-PII] uridylyltransferase
VSLSAGADPAADPSLALRIAAASAERDVPIARATLERLGRRTLAPDGVWPAPVLNALLRLLGAGRPAIAAVEALDQHGVWMRYLPEWSPVRNRPQRNAYHRFTVDRHLLEAVGNASLLQSAVHRPDLLLLGALLHDIGKGQGGDHTEIGIEIVGKLGPRMGLDDHDVAMLQNLVRLHLLLPDAATRRDLDDPETAATVAAAVGDQDTLELLAALTQADSLATGPAAWGGWKAGLVDRLVTQVAATLEGRPPPDTGRADLSAAERQVLAGHQLSAIYEGGILKVAAPDQAGLLAVVAGVLTLAGANVRSATTMSDESTAMALFRFEVTPAFDELPDADRVRADLSAAIEGRMDIEHLLEEREARYSRFAPSTQARVPDARVLFDLESSTTSTIVEVRAPDRGPVLYHVTRALTACGTTITCALVSTLGAEAIDVFYVHGREGGRVEDPAHLRQIEEAVLASL